MLRASDIYGARNVKQKVAGNVVPSPQAPLRVLPAPKAALPSPKAPLPKPKAKLPQASGAAALISGLLSEADQDYFAHQAPTSDIATCKSGHPLVQFVTHNDFFSCDGCRQGLKAGVVMYGCRLCDFDVCASCKAGSPPPTASADATSAAGLPFREAYAAAGVGPKSKDSESARLVAAALASVLKPHEATPAPAQQPTTQAQEPRPEHAVAAQPAVQKETWHKIPRGQAPRVGATIAVRKLIKYKEYELKPGMKGVVQKIHADGHARVQWKRLGVKYLLRANFDAIASKVEEEEDPPTDLEAADAEPAAAPAAGDDAAAMASKALSWLEQAASAERAAQAQGAQAAAAAPQPPARSPAPGWSVIELVTEWTAVQSQVHEHLRATQVYAAQALPGQHHRHAEAVAKAQEEARVGLLRWLAAKEEALKILHVQTSHLGYAELMLLPAEERQHGASLQGLVRAVAGQEGTGVPYASGWLFQWLSGLGSAASPAPQAPAPAPQAAAAMAPLLSKARGPPPGNVGGPPRPSPISPFAPPATSDQEAQAEEDAILAQNLRGALSGLPEHSRGLLARTAAGGAESRDEMGRMKWVLKKAS